MMHPEVNFNVPISQVRNFRDEVLEWDEEGMRPARTQKIGVFILGPWRLCATEVPVGGADYMSVSYFGEWEEVLSIATEAEKQGLKPQVFHESYEDLWQRMRKC